MNAIALPLTVADLVAEYERKVAAADAVVNQFKEAVTALDAAATVQGVYVERVARVMVSTLILCAGTCCCRAGAPFTAA
jgi:flagellar capping protein FliD